MKLTENRLRQIILEEVRLYLLDKYLDEEFAALISENEKADWDAAKWKARKAKARDAALGALGLGVGIGGLKLATDQYSDTRAADFDRQTQLNIAAAETDEAQFEELVDQLNNQYAFRWGKGNDSVVHAPGSDGKVTVLPPSYSVMVKVMQDKKENAERMEQGLKPILQYGNVDLNLDLDHDREYQGDYEENIDGFFKAHQGEFVDAMNVVASHDELQIVPGSGMEEQIIMLDPDKISGDYYLPELGMTAEDYYNYQYGEYMGSGERAALDLPDEEMIVTPDDDEKLDQGLIDATNKRAQQHQKQRMKESKITWKNYRNRKKILA